MPTCRGCGQAKPWSSFRPAGGERAERRKRRFDDLLASDPLNETELASLAVQQCDVCRNKDVSGRPSSIQREACKAYLHSLRAETQCRECGILDGRCMSFARNNPDDELPLAFRLSGGCFFFLGKIQRQVQWTAQAGIASTVRASSTTHPSTAGRPSKWPKERIRARIPPLTK